jgi:hypothetical protein
MPHCNIIHTLELDQTMKLKKNWEKIPIRFSVKPVRGSLDIIIIIGFRLAVSKTIEQPR